MRRFHPQVVITLLDKDLRLTGPAARLLRIPVVARHANDRPHRVHLLRRVAYNRIASHHIANSLATRRTLMDTAPWLDESRITVIHNGIDVDAIHATAPSFLPLPMAAGRPVVASNTSSLPEIVRDGEDGLLVPRAHDRRL